MCEVLREGLGPCYAPRMSHDWFLRSDLGQLGLCAGSTPALGEGRRAERACSGGRGGHRLRVPEIWVKAGSPGLAE